MTDYEKSNNDRILAIRRQLSTEKCSKSANGETVWRTTTFDVSIHAIWVYAIRGAFQGVMFSEEILQRETIKDLLSSVRM